MNDGFVLGTLAAVAWGFADVFVTYLSRRGGFFRTLLLTQIFGVALLVVVALAVEDLPGPSGVQLLALAMLGPIAVAAYAGFYRALELGPIAIVSPIASANGAVVVLVAVFVLGESLTGLQALGCLLVLGFIVLAALEPKPEVTAAPGSGIRLALVASLAFGGYLFALATISDDLGWLVPILVARSVTVAILAAVAVARPPGAGAVGWLGLVGLPGRGPARRVRLPRLQPRRRDWRGGDHERGGRRLPGDSDSGRPLRATRARGLASALGGGRRPVRDGRAVARLIPGVRRDALVHDRPSGRDPAPDRGLHLADARLAGGAAWRRPGRSAHVPS